MLGLLRRLIWLILVVGALVTLDQWSKVWAIDHVSLTSETLVTNLFGGIDIYFTLVTNRGTAWGLFASYAFWLNSARLAIGACLLLYYLFSRGMGAASRWGILLILGGACGNLWDVQHRGVVIDFIDVRLWGWHYPVFNIADIAIVLGAVLFLFSRK